jgi:hypothetical protein
MSATAENTRDRALDAARLVARLLIDVIVGARSLDIFDSLNSKTAIPPVVFHGMRRMCYSETLLGLSKFTEFYQAYHDVIPADCKTSCKNVMKIIQSKGIHEFRSKYVAHLIDRKTGRPLNLDELERYVEKIFGHDDTTFISWVNDQKNIFPTTVVSVLEKTRDEIMKENGISKEEMNQWKS